MFFKETINIVKIETKKKVWETENEQKPEEILFWLNYEKFLMLTMATLLEKKWIIWTKKKREEKI